MMRPRFEDDAAKRRESTSGARLASGERPPSSPGFASRGHEPSHLPIPHTDAEVEAVVGGILGAFTGILLAPAAWAIEQTTGWAPHALLLGAASGAALLVPGRTINALFGSRRKPVGKAVSGGVLLGALLGLFVAAPALLLPWSRFYSWGAVGTVAGGLSGAIYCALDRQ